LLLILSSRSSVADGGAYEIKDQEEELVDQKPIVDTKCAPGCATAMLVRQPLPHCKMVTSASFSSG
jgi:hypothetical protein